MNRQSFEVDNYVEKPVKPTDLLERADAPLKEKDEFVRQVHTEVQERRKMSQETTILVIDDEETIRDSCCQVLTKDGYRAETAADGEAGLQKTRAVEPDLVLIDLKMPGISGMELLRKINDIDPTIVTVVITGYATIESAVEAMKRNAYDFLPKPFTPDQLRIVVKRGLERRRLAIESARLQREKEMMKENFVTLVSHQLRSPLTSVKQYFRVILGGFVGEVAGKQKEMIEKAGDYIDNLLRLIDDWLDMSRVEAGNVAGRFEPVALAPILADVLELVKPLAEARKVSFESDLHDNLPNVLGDRESLKQVFMNLLSNGVNYNRDGGTVTVRTRDQSDDLAVEISDTGIGISQDDLPFIFDEFFRVKTKETMHVPGTGLGLPIAKRIIEAHNGHIRAVSALGKGTTFSIFLPKAKEEQR